MASSSPSAQFGEVARRLVQNRYRVLPIVRGQKNPAIEDWPNYRYSEGDEDRFFACGAGILAGAGVVPVDIDVRDPDAAAKIEAIAERMLGRAPRRIGHAPKSARLYALAGAIPYIATRRFRMPEDAPGAKAHRVEILSQGKQLVCFGVHPETKRPYEWNGHGSPLEVSVRDLTRVTEEALRAFIAEADALLAEFGEPIFTRALADEESGEDDPRDHHTSSLGLRAQNPEQFREMLRWLPNDYDREGWAKLALCIKGALGSEGWPDFEAWCQKSPSYTGRDTRRVWESLSPTTAGAGKILAIARARGWNPAPKPSVSRAPSEAPYMEEVPLEAYADEAAALTQANTAPPARALEQEPVSLEDFHAYMPQHAYLYVPTRELWPAASVNSRIPPIDVGAKKPLSASAWLDQNRPIEQMTWAPGLPMVIEDRLVSGGGWIERRGCRTFNLYQPPSSPSGDPAEAGPWIAHVQRVFPGEAEHIIRWFAQRVQHPEEKLNHALVLGGGEGIGKDTILEPVKYAVGPWNVAEVSPPQLLGRFNGFVKSVILRMSEARDLGEVDRYSLHEHLKTLIAAPPDVIRCDEKNLREYSVLNVTGVIVTTNHVDGLYIPPDSRRYFVAWSELTKGDYPANYWQDIYAWYHKEGGIGHVVAYLRTLDLCGFDPKAPPAKTAAFWRVVDAGRAPEDAELADALDSLGNPPAITVGQLCIYASESFRLWLQDRRNSRQIPHRMEAAGYTAVRNDNDKNDGQWKVDGKRQTIYARRELIIRDRIAAARALSQRH